jgi:hypothetical protein
MEIVGKGVEIAKATFKTALNNRPKTIEKPFSSFKRA